MEFSKDAPLIDHLSELRFRILWGVGVWFFFFALFYALSDWTMELLHRPLKIVRPELSLAVLSVTEGLFASLRLAFYVAWIPSFPFITWQAWKFISPGLFPQERRTIGFFLVPMVCFFYLGGGFCYFFLLPNGLRVLLGTFSKSLIPILAVGDYIDFTAVCVLLFGLMFQLPFLLVVLDLLNILSLETLKNKRRHVFVGAFVVGAVLSPPDAVSQLMVSVPLYGMIEVSFWISAIMRRFRFNATLPVSDNDSMENKVT